MRFASRRAGALILPLRTTGERRGKNRVGFLVGGAGLVDGAVGHVGGKLRRAEEVRARRAVGLYNLLRKKIIDGLTAGSVKG